MDERALALIPRAASWPNDADHGTLDGRGRDAASCRRAQRLRAVGLTPTGERGRARSCCGERPERVVSTGTNPCPRTWYACSRSPTRVQRQRRCRRRVDRTEALDQRSHHGGIPGPHLGASRRRTLAAGRNPLRLGLDPDVVIDAQGDTIAVWQTPSAVQAAIRPAGGSWLAPQTVATPGGEEPQIASDANGDVIVVSTRQAPGHSTGIQAVLRPAGGTFPRRR